MTNKFSFNDDEIQSFNETDCMMASPFTQKSLENGYRHMLGGLKKADFLFVIQRLNYLQIKRFANAQPKNYCDTVIESAHDGHRAIFFAKIVKHSLIIELFVDEADSEFTRDERIFSISTMIQKFREHFLSKRKRNKGIYFDQIIVSPRCDIDFIEALCSLKSLVHINEACIGSENMMPTITIACS